MFKESCPIPFLLLKIVTLHAQKLAITSYTKN